MELFEDKVLAIVSHYQMLADGDNLLVAVSGGVDSMTLLAVLQRLPFKLGLAVFHLNHGLRPEAEDEAKMVAEYAKRHSLPYQIEKIGYDLHDQKGKSLQVAAREERYRLMEAAAERFGCNKIALGHQADDQVETVLMRFLIGAGPEGLAGIPPVRGKFIRPLIGVGREEIEAYACALKLPWAEDSSNAQLIYLRNKIRHSLIPYLCHQYQPGLRGRLKETARICREWNEVMEQLKDEVLIKWGLKSNRSDQLGKPTEGYLIPVSKWMALPIALQRLIFRELFFSLASPGAYLEFAHSQAALQLLTGEDRKQINLPGGIICRKENNNLILKIEKGDQEKLSNKEDDYFITLKIPGFTTLPGGKGGVESRWMVSEEAPEDWNQVSSLESYLDADKIVFPVYLRTRKPGDRFYPLGLKGSKKVKDIFIDCKIPFSQRAQYPLLVDEKENILAVIGLRPDQRYRITEDTRRVLYLRFYPETDSR